MDHQGKRNSEEKVVLHQSTKSAVLCWPCAERCMPSLRKQAKASDALHLQQDAHPVYVPTRHAVCDAKKYQVKTANMLHKQTPRGVAILPIATMQTQFLKVVEATMDKLKKYLFYHMDVAK